ncbi:unnamed protein product [Calicophoron daubneyi]|uniref:Dynein light chain n=1 Tax=Calicophoron daubneyi TaxID=300641 RepID=A0AAV2SYQ0_CALDB
MSAKVGEERALVKSTDMDEEKQHAAVDCTAAAIDRFDDTREIAKYVKKEFDKRFGGTWHCIVGTDFGCEISHKAGTFIYFVLRNHAILVFQAKK